VEYDVRGDLFAHVQSLDLAYFGEKKTGDLMAHFTNDLNAVRDVAGPGLMYAVQMTTALVVSITLMIIIDPILTLFAFLPYPMISVVTFLYGKRMYQSSRRVQDLFGVMSSRVQEDLAGARVIRAYVQEANSARRFRAVNEDYLRANMSVAHLRGRFIAAMSALAGSGIAIALLVGGRQVIREELTLGSLVAFTAYLAELTWPVIAIGWVVSVLQRGASAMGRLAEVFDAEPGIVSGPARGRPRARVAFEHVSFRYPGTRENALTGVSFRLETGRTLGIVGRTGSGKSTILKLLLRFYDPTEGRVLLDGVDLRERNLDEIRTVVGYAPQDAFLFSRTLAQNIAHGVPDAERGRVRAVDGHAGLTEEADELPDGFDTLVGERGVTLSGGQRQRASLARALLLDPDLLILDDTLSSVDAETEQRILHELRRYMSNRTSLIVSHRISAVQEADRVLVLDRGRVIEQGTHEQLVRLDGLYARMHERQRLVAEIERTS
jgi:ATP-binding cassette subfamily B protein